MRVGEKRRRGVCPSEPSGTSTGAIAVLASSLLLEKSLVS